MKSSDVTSFVPAIYGPEEISLAAGPARTLVNLPVTVDTATPTRSEADVLRDIGLSLSFACDNIFWHNGSLVEIARGGRLSKINETRFAGILSSCIAIVKRDQSGNIVDIARRPTSEERKAVFGLAREWARPLKSIICCPFIHTDGTVVAEDGYHEPTQTWLAWDRGPVALPTFADAQQIIFDLVKSWNWDKPGATIALCLLILPVVRPLIKGPTPLHIISAPGAGAGKSYLGEIASIIATGRAEQRGFSDWNQEASRELVEGLTAGPPVYFLDDVPADALENNSHFRRAITAYDDVAVRAVGANESLVTSKPIWILTSIGLAEKMGVEMARRGVAIRLLGPSRIDQTKFAQERELHEDVRDNREKYVGAILRLAIDGLVNGKPLRSFKNFNEWANLMGRIIDHIGLGEHFLEGSARMVAAEDREWLELIEHWPHDESTTDLKWIAASEICRIVADVNIDLKLKNSGSQTGMTTSLGIHLKKMAQSGKNMGGWVFRTFVSSHPKVSKYRPEREIVATPVRKADENDSRANRSDPDESICDDEDLRELTAVGKRYDDDNGPPDCTKCCSYPCACELDSDPSESSY